MSLSEKLAEIEKEYTNGNHASIATYGIGIFKHDAQELFKLGNLDLKQDTKSIVETVRQYSESKTVSNRQQQYWGWLITGNEEYAFASYRNEIHHFTRDPEVNNDAYVRAMGWAYINPPDFEE